MNLKKNFRREVLDNGLTIVFEKRNVPVVSVAFAVRSGGANESLSEKGISHFIEHMLYKGTKSRNSKQISEEIEKNGGVLNGFTDEILTAYWCKMPSKHLGVALEVLGDMVKNPLFDEEELEKERKVIFEEMKMRKDRPDVYTVNKIQDFLYGGTLGQNLIGTEKTIGAIDRKKILIKFKQIYTPNNLILCVVGGVDFGEVINFAKKNFGNGKKKIPKQKIISKNSFGIEKRKGVDQANLIFAYHVPIRKDEKSYAAAVLSTMMAEGLSSRLFSEIREKRNLAYAIHGYSQISSDFAYNAIYVGTMAENVQKVKKLILEEFKKVSEGLKEGELDQVKTQIIGNHQVSIEDSKTQMANLLLEEAEGDSTEYYDYEEKISKVKLKEVKELASKVKKGNYSFFALVPEEGK